MNRTALPTAVALVLAATFAFSQQPQPQQSEPAPAATAPAHEHNPHRQAMHLARELNLTPDQTAKVEPILANRDQQIAALRSDTTIAPTDQRKQMQAIQRSTREQLNSVMTPDQMQQFKAIQHARRAKGQPVAASPSA